MIRVNRDPAFWNAVGTHPVVVAAQGPISQEKWAEILGNPTVLPLASDHGGFIFGGLSSSGRVAELHTLFTPEGWGREAHGAAIEAFNHVFDIGIALVFTNEMGENTRSRPPRSFGFTPCGEFAPSPHGMARTWALTYLAWLASPARRRACQ